MQKPDFWNNLEESNAVKEMTLLEIELQIIKDEIEEINKKDFKESFQYIKEEIINETLRKKTER